MKRIYLIRHATAAPRGTDMPDFERSLIPKGVKEAKRVAKRIYKNGRVTGVLVSSPANRALETAHIFAKAWDYPVQKVIVKPELYDSASGEAFWNLIKSFDNGWDSVVLFGHDPSLSELAKSLAKGFNEMLPKSGAVGFAWNTDSWERVTPESGRLILLEFPKPGYEPDKLMKSATRELSAMLSDSVGALLSEIDTEGAAAIRKRIRKSSQRLAEDFLDESGNKEVVLSYWLQSRQKEKSNSERKAKKKENSA